MKKIYILSIAMLLVSCGKFLEPKSQSEFTPKNVNSLNEMLTQSGYYQISSHGTSLFAYMEIFSDDLQTTTEAAYFGDTELSSELPLKKLFAMSGDTFENPADFGRGNSPWQHFYESILCCNAVMDYLPSVNGSESEKAYVKAQALFLRALSYFYLVNYYGQPYNYNKKAYGVPLKLISDLSDKPLPRNSVEEVYNQIVADLLESEKCWESVPDKQFKRNFRANLPATQFLLAKVYLFMENWSECIKYTEKVLSWNNFSLYDLNGFVKTSNIIVNYATYDNSETIWTYGSLGDYIYMIQKNYNMKRIDPTNLLETIRSRQMFMVAPSLLESYGTSDLRKDLYIFAQYVNEKKDGETGYFLDVKSPIGKVKHNTNQSPLPDPYSPAMKFRLSEVYLMVAEAYAMMGGNDDKALSAINTIREKRINSEGYTPTTGLTGEALIRFVQEERRRELCFEGSRWFDMRRWGMKSYKREWRKYGDIDDTFTILDNDPAFTFPIPRDVINRDKITELNPLSPRIINN